ncbi:hypothetical protein AVEN_169759-1 [Araneus ventricosus]|uniref:Uncharacterized protein n=1 Tax=Araneus ventricosus TaxID=182803 RepID=A0A4Y2HL82_ARAVE|nr:hypothetical protein AVEN_169759-1 [Araneus ventricosus]
MELYSSVQGSATSKNSQCVFCDKNHSSAESSYAQGLPTEQRKGILPFFLLFLPSVMSVGPYNLPLKPIRYLHAHVYRSNRRCSRKERLRQFVLETTRVKPSSVR